MNVSAGPHRVRSTARPARAARPWAAAAALAATLASAPDASAAYCRTTTCEGVLQCSDHDFIDPSCKPLFWARDCVGFSVQKDASRKVSLDRANEIVRQAFGVWLDSNCAGAPPNIRALDLGPVACNRVEYNPASPNANLIVFRDRDWPHGESAVHLGLTFATFDAATGEIFDADIEVNTAQDITIDDANPRYDLLSVLTHEVGHFFGVGHSPASAQVGADEEPPTMVDKYEGQHLLLRTLEASDEEAICAMYRPTAAPPSAECNPIPRHGFSPECLADQTEGDCSIAASPGSAPFGVPTGAALATCAGLAALVLRRLKRKTGRRKAQSGI